MIRGTTPMHSFELPFGVEVIKSGVVTYVQENETILEKELTECNLEGNIVSVKLTQEETLKFNCANRYVFVQLRLLTQGGDALASDVMTIEVKRCLNSEVLV